MDVTNDSVTAKIDSGREAAADRLESAADTIRERMGPTSPVSRVADYMGRTAGYMRSHDLQEMMHDAERMVRSRPTEFIVGAVVLGMLLGKAFGESSES